MVAGARPGAARGAALSAGRPNAARVGNEARLRQDARSLSGILRALVRSTVQGRSRDAMLKVLRATKNGLESH